jgi:hypothetical protein
VAAVSPIVHWWWGTWLAGSFAQNLAAFTDVT